MPVVEGDLVVEDGTGLTTSNTYVTLAEATEYHRLRDNTLWAAATENDTCAALIRASQYLDTRWIFQGVELTEGQALVFPRDEIYNTEGVDVGETVPIEIKHAVYEYALAVLGDGTATVDLSPSPDQSNGLSVTMQRDKVGDLETETRYSTSVGPRVTVSYPTADRIVRRSGYTSGGNNGGTIR